MKNENLNGAENPALQQGAVIRWVAVEDDMPHDGMKVLCFAKKYNEMFTAICRNKNNDGRFEYSDKCYYWAGTEVSHWAALPQLPVV